MLANGCTDSTAEQVRASAALLPNLWLVEINIADKANAWNLFVHDIFPMERLKEFETCFLWMGTSP